MKPFYIHDGKKQLGPYNLQELKSQSITLDTLVWQPGMADWTKAGDVEALGILFNYQSPASMPPPLKVNAPKRPFNKILAAATILLILVVSAFLFFKPKKETSAAAEDSTVSVPHTHDSLITDKVVMEDQKETPRLQVTEASNKTRQAETFNPAKYLVKTIKTRKNIVGKTIIEGTVTNKTPNMIFKDIVIDVAYLSKTGTTISTQRFVVYEVAKPGKKVPFKFKARSPEGTKTFSTELVTAAVVR